MYNRRMGWSAAVLLAFMMALPGIPALEECARASPDIIFNVNTFADGNGSSELVLSEPGNDSSAGLTLPNGATVLGARMNISAAPLNAGRTDCPRNVTVDVGNDGVTDWGFRGTGYGDMGHQYQFDTGSNSSVQKSGNDGSSTSIIQLPAGAKVLNARCNVTSTGISSTVTLLGGVNAVQSPFNIGQYRMQWLYRAAELNRSGVVDKIGWRVYSGTGSGTLSNFKLLLGHTTLEATTDTFDNNWGGENPTTLIDTDSYNYWDTNGWIVLDLPNAFVYNNTKNLLIEMSFSARQGTNYLLYFYYMNPGSGTRRLYNNVDYTSATGILDDPNMPLHYDFTIEFASKFCMTVDLGGDSVPEYINDDGNWNSTALEISGALGTFMGQAAVNHTDGYGNRFALVPIVVHTELGGGVNISNLSITYEYTAVVSENPAYIGDLAEALDGLLPYTPDGNFTTIPVTVASVRPGRLRLSNLSIDYRPPLHYPTIHYRDPGPASVVMNENESLGFSIKASDEYGYPLTAIWYIDTLEVARGVDNTTFVTDYDSSGNHSVVVTVNNTMRLATAAWKVTVLNVNRPPAVASFSPGAEVTINEEESVNLAVTASDPDIQDTQLKYNWYVGATEQGINSDGFRFKTDLRMAGTYSIRVKVSDAGGLSVTQNWQVTVVNVNVPPVVDSITPNLNPSIRETDSATFTVSASDFDRQMLTYLWYLDGVGSGAGQQFTYRAGYDAAGTHLVRVVISDGESNVSRNWTVTVDNVNRPPVPAIERPAGKLEFLDTDTVNFSASSSSDPDGDALHFKWSEGLNGLSTAMEFEKRFPPGVHEVTLEATDSNRATNRTSVKFTVRYIKLVANVDRDRLAPVEGDRMTFTAWVNNTGDAAASSVSVDFLVDGASIGTRAIESIAGGGVGSATFGWKAKKGEHTLSVKIGGQSWNSTLTVEPKPATPAADQTLPILILAAVAVAAAGAVAFAMTRKKRPRAVPEPGRPHAPPETAAPAAAAPNARAKPAPPAVPAAGPSKSDKEVRGKARDLIDSTQERIADLLENPEKGVDVTAAMGALEKAQESLKAGKPEEALRLAGIAAMSLAAKPSPAALKAGEAPPRQKPPEKPAAAPECAGCGESLEPGWSVCPTCGKTV